MIVYEFPLNEHVRTLLKLERLFQQVLYLARQQDPLLHQTALFGIFDLFELGSRNEMRSELQMELTRLRQRTDGAVVSSGNESSVDFIDQALAALQAMPARLDQPLRDCDWLAGVRQRANIPGGVNGFDLPQFHYWQHMSPAQRKADLVNWISPMLPLHQALSLLLKRIRENGAPKALLAPHGYYQQALNGRSSHMLRIGLPVDSQTIPEASANRHAINIRFLNAGKGLPARCEQDIEFQLCFCQL